MRRAKCYMARFFVAPAAHWRVDATEIIFVYASGNEHKVFTQRGTADCISCKWNVWFQCSLLLAYSKLASHNVCAGVAARRGRRRNKNRRIAYNPVLDTSCW